MKEYTLEEIMDAFEECAKQREELEQQNKQLKSILTELEEWLCGEKIVVYNVDGKVGILRGDILNKIQKLKEFKNE